MKRKAITAVFTVLLLSAVFIQPTHANSAQRHWSGTDSTGAQHKTFFGIDQSFIYRRIFVLILLLILMKTGERKC